MPLKPVFPRTPFTKAAFAYLPYTAFVSQGLAAQAVKRLLPSMAALPITAQVAEALLPAAYLTGEKELAHKAEKVLETYLQAQAEDGDWADLTWQEKISLCHALMAWYEARRPEKVLPALLKFCLYLRENWGNLTADSRMMAAAGEWMQFLSWMYHVTGKKPLLKMMEQLRLDALDWTSYFHTFSVVKPMTRVMPMTELEAGMAQENGDIGGFYTRQYYLTHGEYLARSLKTPALFAQLSGSLKEKEAPKAGYQKLMHYHGTSAGSFNAAPLLAGADPALKASVAAAGELAASLGEICRLHEDGRMADALEKVAYNALLGAESFGLVQPEQAVNTVKEAACPYVEPKEAVSTLVSLVKGLCALMRHQFLALEEDGIALNAYEAGRLTWRMKGASVKMNLEGDYLKDGRMTLTVDSKNDVEFELKLRIPGWCADACITVNEEGGSAAAAGEFVSLRRLWRKGDKVTIELPMPLREEGGYRQTVCVMKGPQLMAIPSLKTPWRYGIEVTEQVMGYPLPGWEEDRGVTRMPPAAVKTEDVVLLDLVPYWEAKVHVAQFPKVRTNEQT